MSTFRITSTTTRMDQNGKVSFTVTNTSGANLRGRASIKTDDGVSPDAFDIAPPKERDFPVDSTEEFAVTFKKPKDAPAGDHKFQLWVVDPRLSDEIGNPSDWIGYTILEEKTKPFPILWLIIPAAVLVVAAIGVGTWWYFNDGPGHHVVPPVVKVANVQVVHRDPTDFGTEQVNQSSVGSLIQLHNSGNRRATVTVTRDGPNAADFNIAANTCADVPLEPNADCEVHIAFRPSSQGDKTASLTFTVDSGTAPPAIPLTGSALGVSVVCVNPGPVILYDRYQSGTTAPTTSPPTVVTVQNCGSADLNIQGVALTGDAGSLGHFTITNNACAGRKLIPGATGATGTTCTITLQLINATYDWTWSAMLNIVYDAPNSPQQVPVSGIRSSYICSIRCTTFRPSIGPILSTK